MRVNARCAHHVRPPRSGGVGGLIGHHVSRALDHAAKEAAGRLLIQQPILVLPKDRCAPTRMRDIVVRDPLSVDC
jgi:hypothetical protein